ncbi:TonB-dependent receptor [Flavobacterium sp. DG1-102-2]|uniref:SusC/RagA family TonB-linked outer membrane protein n=1 Tax=Flavobacterium sp. DG1-102-2 TaxID=3081663 RepID=UPI002948E0D2|nr:TonB-dependent receptor [Flavobacterium sp. DG1-102-2]MDV6169778.1 TonB-dependent receptor [Flavobacterium sp. DG1-102-2]
MRNIIRYLCFLLLILCTASGWAQTITGKITDGQNMPLPGATVLVKGTQTSTATDIDGNYTIKAAAGNELEFSYLGFISQTIAVNSTTTTLNISLKEDNKELDEIIVVGASIKKGDLTGAVGSLSGAKLTETPTPNVVQAMQGRVAGVYVQQSPAPGQSGTIRIRGNNSLNFGGNPIFVIDGLITDGNFENINPNDIASMEVLKDASATALYGSRAANGVVVITTKKGSRSGEAKIQYDTWTGISEFAKTIPLMNAQQLFDLRVDAFTNRYMDENPGADRQAYINQITSDGSTVFAPYELETYRSGKSYNWLDQVTRSGFQTNHNLSFSGGGEKGTYFVSFSYSGQDGLVKNSDFKRYNAKINLTQDLKSWLQFGTNTTFSRSENTYQDGSIFGVALGANPLLPIDPKVTYLRFGESFDQNLYNPLVSLDIINSSKRNRLTSSNYLSAKPINGLDIRTTFSTEITDQANFDYTPSYTGQSIRNSYDGEAHHWRYAQLNYQWDNTVSYSKVFAEKHDVSVLGGITVMKNSENNTDVRARGFVSDDMTYMALSGAYLKDNVQLGSGFTDYTTKSYFARANYTFNGKYNITGTVRRDGSSKFGPNDKWGTFPSVAASWDVAKESFLSGSEKLNQLKVRVGYGIVGNQNVPPYRYFALYNAQVSNNSGTYESDNYADNFNLKWERQKQFNVGLDAGLFNNRLTINANYFNIKNDNLLMIRNLPVTAGYMYVLQNIGATTNKGIELQVSADIIKNEDFKWNVSANISSAKNKVTKLFNDATEIYNLGGYSNNEIQRTGNFFLGESVNTVYAFQYDGIAQQGDDLTSIDYGSRTVQPGDIKIKDRNGDGVINDNDRYVVGDLNPDYYGGFSTDFNYKGFALNAVFAYSIGGKRPSSTYESYMNSGGMSAAHTDLLNRWTPENTNTDVPRAYYGGGRYTLGETDKSIQDASFLRLNALTLSYTLPADVTENVYLKNVRVYVTGSNLFLITKYKGYDPEGGDSYPNSRMIAMGLNVTL